MPWKQLLAWATGQIDESLRQKLEFVLEENRVYCTLLDRHSPHWRLKDIERKGLAQKRKPLGTYPPLPRSASRLPPREFANPSGLADGSTFTIAPPPDPLPSSKSLTSRHSRKDVGSRLPL